MHLFSTSFSVRTVALASVVLLGACSKKSDDPTPTPAPAATTYATTWTVDGKNYTATTSNATVSGNTLSLAFGQVTSATENYTIGLTLPAATGSYDLSTASTLSIYGSTVNGTATGYLVISGNATVTTLSATEIIGTFSFTAASTNPISSKSITNGKFAIKR